MRAVEALMVIVGLLSGVLVGWGVRTVAGMPSRACFGVVVSASSGAVFGAQGGNVPRIQCQAASGGGG